jgi:hypothetical protein
LFKPWSSTYELTTEKKITVESVQMGQEKNMLSVSVTNVKEEKKKIVEGSAKKKTMKKMNKRIDDMLTSTIKKAVKQTLEESSK